MVEEMKKNLSSALEEEVEGARRASVASSSSAGAEPAAGADPKRFKGKRPTPKPLPEAVWINPPTNKPSDEHEVA